MSNINYGRKTIVGADRHQQRKRTKLEEDLASTHRRREDKAAALVVQQARVHESEHKGHGKRLQQRQRTLDKLQDEVQAVQASNRPSCMSKWRPWGSPKSVATAMFANRRS